MEDQKQMPESEPSQDGSIQFKSKESNLKSYIGSKIIQARPMDYESFARMTGRWENGQETMGDGYQVIYEDGYKSWSPKDVFERCYRLITESEKSLI